MADLSKGVLTYIKLNWERILFSIVGSACLLLCFRALIFDNIVSGSALFGMAVFSFFYSNLARFKKFKGLGFEAELWEDKQKEAADLVDRLKSIVSIYTREIVMNKVMSGRWDDGGNWDEGWAVYDELTGKHAELGQKIDFVPLKRDVYRVFMFDICAPVAASLGHVIERAKTEASEHIQRKYGSPITDVEGYNDDQKKLGEIRSQIDDLFIKAGKCNIAELILTLTQDATTKLENSFSITPRYDKKLLDRLHIMASLSESGPIAVTPQLIEWAHWREDNR